LDGKIGVQDPSSVLHRPMLLNRRTDRRSRARHFLPLHLRLSLEPAPRPSPRPTMKPDDNVCLCFHVSRRKVEQFIRVEKPRRASQLAECYGAGTGCGWCRPYLRRLLEASRRPSPAGERDTLDGVDPQRYASDRSAYRARGAANGPDVLPGSEEA